MLLALAVLLGPVALAQDSAPPSSILPTDAQPSWALEENFSGTQDFRLRYYRTEDRLPNFEDRRILDYVEAVDRLNLTAGTAKVTLSVQGDAVALFGNRYILDGRLYHERDLYAAGVSSPFPDALFLVEKATVTLTEKQGTLALGDSYTSFGRGIALNLVKNTDIDIDTSVRGVKAAGHFGLWDVTLLSGVTNPQQVAMENRNVGIAPDIFHAITGARVERFGLGRFNLGAHGVLYQFSRGYDPEAGMFDSYVHAPDAVVAGANVEAMGLGGIDWYVEGDVFDYLSDDLSDELGYEVYASASAYPGRASVLVEAKRQYGAEHLNAYAGLNSYEIASGPTLEYERVITEDSSAAVNSNDLWGGRVRVDLPIQSAKFEPGHLPPTLVPSISQAVFRDEDLDVLHFNRTPETISHTVASLLYIHRETHLQLNVGYRHDQRDPSPELGDLGADRVIHGDMSLAIPIAGPVSIELSPGVMRFWWGANAQQQADFLDISNALAVKIGTPWIVLLYTDYSDNPLIDSVGNLGEHVYGAAELQWKPSSATTVKAFYGAYRAGIRCAGGQCRSLPGFDGGRISLTTAF